ncbi:hypothetical protein LXA43DRAFT_1135764 [Ganoderma leucocontextum]|nr:hypothetical protein LXA43DRAFT_1135764 [Ganoderma leucocontextum]
MSPASRLVTGVISYGHDDRDTVRGDSSPPAATQETLKHILQAASYGAHVLDAASHAPYPSRHGLQWNDPWKKARETLLEADRGAFPGLARRGIIATAPDISKSNCELISVAVTALGGQWRTALTHDVTDLFTLAPGSTKYEIAMHHHENPGILTLVPHWFDDTERLCIHDLPTSEAGGEDEDHKPPPEPTVEYDTASLSNHGQREVRPASRNIWKGKKLLLGLSLILSDHQRNALSADISRQCGEVVELSSSKSSKTYDRARAELVRLDEADIFVTRQ